MTKDIVERLRYTAEVGIFTASMTDDYASFTEAADEIAALRKRVEELDGALAKIDKWCCPVLCVNCADNRETARAHLLTPESDNG